jgi:hypothetical protein
MEVLEQHFERRGICAAAVSQSFVFVAGRNVLDQCYVEAHRDQQTRWVNVSRLSPIMALAEGENCLFVADYLHIHAPRKGGSSIRCWNSGTPHAPYTMCVQNGLVFLCSSHYMGWSGGCYHVLLHVQAFCCGGTLRFGFEFTVCAWVTSVCILHEKLFVLGCNFMAELGVEVVGARDGIFLRRFSLGPVLFRTAIATDGQQLFVVVDDTLRLVSPAGQELDRRPLASRREKAFLLVRRGQAVVLTSWD